MRCLLDTHAALWLIGGDPRASARARSLYDDQAHEFRLSVASIWEMAIKIGLGKLKLATSLHEFVDGMETVHGVNLLAIEVPHVKNVSVLPMHHRDPFDRLLASQALIERLPILSQDLVFEAYSVERIW
jgi:PIN domain nuclease of toxin-antitoxin system